MAIELARRVEENARQNNMILRARGRTVAFPRRPLVMGILNVNDDSFSGDGSLDLAWAERRVREMIADGADIIDIGAESARTNRPAISEAEELRRLAPLLERFHDIACASDPADDVQLFPALLSINTWRPSVAGPALAIAGDLLNDMSGLESSENASICARAGAALLLMHTVGQPKEPHTHVSWPDIVGSVAEFFADRIARAESAGVPHDSIVLDPGFDFAKPTADNLALLRELGRLRHFERPILLPISRKGFIGDTLGLPDPRDRDAGTIACLVHGMEHGATIFRVHNVKAARLAVLTMEEVLG